VLFVLPSLFILIALSWVYMAFGQVALVAGLFYGIKPAVTAWCCMRPGASAAARSRTAVPMLWAIAAASLRRHLRLHACPSRWVLGRRRIGVLRGRVAPAQVRGRRRPRAGAKSYGPALIDDHTPDAAARALQLEARLARWRSCSPRAVGLRDGAAGRGQGWDGALAQMGWFFTKAALLTFGGAYAVLPYVYQGAVEQFQWLTGTQMIDGLALGETTPGPLIMVVAFVGFVGGWTKPGASGRTRCSWPAPWRPRVVTFFTFLPSFFFILPGAAGRIDPRQPEVHRAADRHHGRRGRRDRQPGGVLRLPRALAARPPWSFEWPPPSSAWRPPSRSSVSRLASFPWCWPPASSAWRCGSAHLIMRCIHGRTTEGPPVRTKLAEGLSEKLLRSHHQNNYGGAVKRLNAIRAEAARAPVFAAPGFELNGLKREELIATNSMLLHELYFDCLGAGEAHDAGDGARAAGELRQRRALARGVRGHGQGAGRRLGLGAAGVPAARRHAREPMGGRPHARGGRRRSHPGAGHVRARVPHGLRRRGRPVRRRLHGQHQLGSRVRALPGGGGRRQRVRWPLTTTWWSAGAGRPAAGVFEQADALIPGASWRDPAKWASWSSALPRDKPVVVYCVYGHEVGRATAMRLRAAGVDARFLRGGIDGWKAAGRPLAKQVSLRARRGS
jgi:chromate transport protein ChrA/rhodanese-related sulfurtransferase